MTLGRWRDAFAPAYLDTTSAAQAVADIAAGTTTGKLVVAVA